MEPVLQWVCTGHNPTIWTLGWYANGEYKGGFAWVERHTAGHWLWNVYRPYPMFGSAPSRLLAFDDCRQAIQRAYSREQAAAAEK